MLTPTEKIWHNGRFIKWEDATVHVLSHVLHYGSSVFEGIRCYSTPSGPAVFRLREHVRRMLDSAWSQWDSLQRNWKRLCWSWCA